jgi:hypothetical protein
VDVTARHFTYKASIASSLEQGDLLARTPELEAALQSVHRHYVKPDYQHFLVLSQTCDLVQRDGRQTCKAPYVSLAAVRPLHVVLQRELASNQQDTFERRLGACSDSKRQKLVDFMRKLLNNNHGEYFYLEAEPGLGFSDACCAFLRLSVALRAADHYQTLLAARRLALAEVFQAKLGWLVGNLYSRVGTPDWVPDSLTKDAFEDKVSRIVGEVAEWVSESKLKEARKAAREAHLDVETAPTTELRRLLDSASAPRKKQLVIQAVLRVVAAHTSASTARGDTSLARLLEMDPDISSLLKG